MKDRVTQQLENTEKEEEEEKKQVLIKISLGPSSIVLFHACIYDR
jgi:hypothetical protein